MVPFLGAGLYLTRDVGFRHPETRLAYPDLPFYCFRQHSKYGIDVSAGKELKGAGGVDR